MENFSLTNNINLKLPVLGDWLGTWGTPLNDNFSAIDSLFGAGGHTHSGSGGDGPQIPHANLLNSGTNSHAVIDAHIANTAIHQDTRIAAVRTDTLSTTVLNVTDIRFANATVTQVAEGIALVTPTATGGTAVSSEPRTAPVVFFDAFTGNPGLALSDQGWQVLTQSSAAAEYATTATTGQTGSGAEMLVASTLSQDGYCTNILQHPAPHSWVQRISVSVSDYGPTSGSPDASDQYALWLNLLASNREVLGNSSTAPIEAGLSFVLSAQNVGGNTVVVPRIVARTASQPTAPVTYSGPFPAPANWSHPTTSGSGWTNLPVEYMEGHHEFSLSLLDSDRSKFTLSYYYGGGLIFSREFTVSDGAFYEAVLEIINDLQVTTNPSVPDFGQFSFSTTYSLVADSDYTFKVKCVSAASVGEQTDPRVVSVPNIAAPPPPTTTPVCSGNAPWTTIVIPGQFDPDGTGPIAPQEWTVTQNFAATTLLSAGFIIENNANSTTHRIYCGAPTVNSPVVCVPALTRVTESFLGANLPVPQYSNFSFFAASGDIPVDWSEGNGGTTYSIGDELPATFLQLDRAIRADNTTTGHTIIAGLIPGTRLPWGSLVTMKVTPLYQSNASYIADFDSTIEICPAIPVIQQTAAYIYRRGSGWIPLTPTQPVYEGETVFLSVSGYNIPLGTGFWQSGNGFDGAYGIDDTAGTSGSALRLLSGVASPATLVYNSISTGRVDTGATTPVTGIPPTTVVASENDPGVGYVRVSSNQEHVIMIARLGYRAWNGNAPEAIRLAMRDTETPVQFADVTLIDATDICPAQPVIDLNNTSISDTTASATVTLTVRVTYPDADCVLTLDSGFTTSGILARDAAGVSIVGNEFAETWTVTGLTLGATGGTAITVTALNPSVTAFHPTLDDDTVTLGAIDEVFTSTPSATYSSGTLVEDTDSVITFSVDETTVEAGTYLTFEGSNSEFFTVQTVDRTSQTLVGDDRDWLVTVRTRDLVGGGSLPATGEITFNNPNSGLTGTVSAIPTQAVATPSITTVELDSAGSGTNTWKVTELGTRTVFVTVSNSTPGLTRLFLTNITGSIEASSSNPRHISGNVYALDVTITAAEPTDTFGILVANTTFGDPEQDTEAVAITMTAAITLGSLTNAFSELNEGHYFTFNIPGDFITDGSNITLDFRDSGGTTLINGAVTIDTETTTLLAGSARLADNKSGEQVYIYVELQSEGVSDTFTTSEVVAIPPQPVISTATVSPNTEGTTGATITINGTNLAPPTPPSGQSTLSYGYTFTSGSGAAIFANLVQTSVSPTQLVWTANINPGTGNDTVGLTINYLGGNSAASTNLATILASTSESPVITALAVTGPGLESPGLLFPEAGTTATLTITGTGLGSANIGGADANPGVRLSVIGQEDLESAGLKESPPGAGLHQDLFKDFYTNVAIQTQSDTEIVAKITLGKKYIDTKLRVHLFRTESHALGAGEWSQGQIDGITNAAADHSGLTLDGPTTTSLIKVNPLVSQGTTRLDIARAFQAEIGPGTEGTSFSVLVRLDTATGKPPSIVAVADSTYPELALTNISVAATANAFEWTVTGTIPDPATSDSYPSGTFSLSTPLFVGLSLSSGIPICGGVCGASSWTTPADEQDYFVTL